MSQHHGSELEAWVEEYLAGAEAELAACASEDDVADLLDRLYDEVADGFGIELEEGEKPKPSAGMLLGRVVPVEVWQKFQGRFDRLHQKLTKATADEPLEPTHRLALYFRATVYDHTKSETTSKRAVLEAADGAREETENFAANFEHYAADNVEYPPETDGYTRGVDFEVEELKYRYSAAEKQLHLVVTFLVGVQPTEELVDHFARFAFETIAGSWYTNRDTEWKDETQSDRYNLLPDELPGRAEAWSLDDPDAGSLTWDLSRGRED